MTEIASTATPQPQPQIPIRELRIQFFDYLFGKSEGYLCIASADKAKTNFMQKFFKWPTDKEALADYIQHIEGVKNVWFCVNLLQGSERLKKYVLPATFAWADLDAESPQNINPTPTCVVESSSGRYQAYWRLTHEVPGDVAEDFSKRLAYSSNADKSGWDLTQLLRVPWTRNFKYEPAQPVKLLAILDKKYHPEEFDTTIPALPDNTDLTPASELPTELPSVDNILYRYKGVGGLDEEFANLYSRTPDLNADWSRLLWRFINKCFDMGMTKEEVFVVAGKASCNKYNRDNRPTSYLWRDVDKAAQEHKSYELLVGGKIEVVKMPHLVDFDEFEEDTFIKEYREWANHATDAPEQYHELTCFIALSAVICSGLYLKVEWGEIVPNLWGLLLGESTLTRKTTAMRLAVDMLKDIDENLILATDGSAEGLLTGLSHRPNRVSIFWKDEVSGFFDSINRKDYLAGLPEVLTQLYDVPKVLTRLLRKETVSISEPYFIFFGGGIRDKVYSLLNDEYILSGFLPRFLVVSGENDLTRLRRTGPPTEISTERKDNIVRALTDFRDRYNPLVTTTIAGQEIQIKARIEARLSPEAWEYYGTLEDVLVNAGNDSDIQMLALPTFSRLAFSLLKMSLLVAASRRTPDASSILHVEAKDVKQAAFYIEKWGHYSIDLLMNAGRTSSEKLIDRALATIKRRDGITKAEFMQRLHLSARDSKDLIDTMVQRGLIDIKASGRGHRLYVF